MDSLFCPPGRSRCLQCCWAIASAVVLGFSFRAECGPGRHEGKTVMDFYEVKEKENQLPVIRMSQVGARKRKEGT